MLLHKTYIWEKYDSWEIGQSDCKILKLARSLEQMDEIVRFFVWWYKLMKVYELKLIYNVLTKHGQTCVCRTFSSSLLHVIIPRNHLPFFENIFKLYILAQIFKYFALPPFLLLFFWKIACMLLLSRIGSAHSSHRTPKLAISQNE